MNEEKKSTHLDVLTQKNLIILTSSLGIILIGATIIFGWNVLLIASISYATAFIVEIAFAKIRKRPLDFAWYVAPMVFALLLPPTSPWWMVMIGSFFGIFFGNSVFGGTGKNIFNPAVVGVLFLTISFPNEMLTKWIDPTTGIIGTSTPLSSLYRGSGFTYSFKELLFGSVPGATGETFRIAILVLGIALIILKIIDWRIPLSFLATIFLLNLVGRWIDPGSFVDPLYSLFVGSVLFTAFFIAPEPVTAPIRPWGRVIYGVGIAIITVIIRSYTAFPEGIIFAVILMNATSGLIDGWSEGKVKNKEEVQA